MNGVGLDTVAPAYGGAAYWLIAPEAWLPLVPTSVHIIGTSVNRSSPSGRTTEERTLNFTEGVVSFYFVWTIVPELKSLLPPWARTTDSDVLWFFVVGAESTIW